MEFVGREMSIPKELEQVMKLRDGSVLGKKMILKNDHFPGCQNKRRFTQIEGAPNYVRQAYSLCVHGVATPTAAGIRNVLSHIGAHKDGKRVQVLWISLREEPVVYLNGRPFVPREVEKPFSNIEYTGINMVKIEQMEARLKEDILIEASRYGNKILVTDELPDGQMVDQWEPVSTDSLKTLLEVYEELQVEGYLVDYERVPVTDGKSPKEADFDTLFRKISQADINTEIVFNCQMGRGRTTTGMLIATLVYFKRTGASGRGLPRNSSSGRIFKAGENITINLPNSEEAIRRGEYDVVRSLIRVLEGGVEGKRQVDEVIDECASTQHFLVAIATYRRSIFRQPDEKKRKAALSFFVEYLEIYYFLICFAVYLHSEGAFLQSGSLVHVSFADWMRARPALYSILHRQLRRDPLGALGYAAMKPSSTNIAESTDGRPQEMSVVAELRNGAVLGSQTVLKSDHSAGCQSSGLRWRMEGAPNFREVLGFPVYGVANPTIDGIRSVIEKVWSLRGVRPVFWHNMREEPIIYINGKPFVVREVESPYKNMLGCKGIDRDTVEGREARLKEDILREAKRYEGAIMVIHETKDGHFDLWEHVDADSVKTPLEVFKCLEAEGLSIKYARMPITDGKPPKCSDFDTLTSNIASASKDTAFVFNCQMGRGRTTTGTVIACLVKLRISYGRPIKVLYGVQDCYRVAEEPPIGGGETGSDTEEEPGRVFGMDDIPLLLKITTLFDNGVESREALDAVIDRSSRVQNIREAVLQYRKVFSQQYVEPRVRSAELKRGAEYLKTYFWLIAFAAYIGSKNLDEFFAKGESKMTFKKWLHQRAEMQTMKWSMRLGPRRIFTISEELWKQHRDAVMESTVNKRRGSVLGKGSILKMYLLPGQTSSRLQINEEDGDSTETIRKEAVVYINGTPFVLRELSKHVDTLKDVGTTDAEVENIETQLKEDMLSEVRETGGQMLLHRTEYGPASNQSRVIGYWENIQSENVKTPAEVYATDVSYHHHRLPLARERDALASDVEAIEAGYKDGSLGLEAKMDIISTLPKDLLQLIGSFLSAKEAVLVSVLSQSFKDLFKIIPLLDVEDSVESLMSFCSLIMDIPVATTRVRRVSLKCGEFINSVHQARLNTSLRHVIKLGVIDLELCIHAEDGYSLPLEVFTCKTVVKLKLGKGIVIDVIPPNALLPALETLFLDSVRFYSRSSDCVFQLFVSASPELKELKMDGICWESWEWSGILSSESLQRLTISRSEGYHGIPDEITFNTPGLLYLDYADCVPRAYPSINFTSLVEAKLKLHLVVNPQWDFDFPYDDDRYLSNATKLIKGIRNVKILELISSVEWFDIFRKSVPKLEVSHLTIHRVDFSLRYFREFITFFLTKAPHLKTLVIKNRRGQTLTFDIPRDTITTMIDKLRNRNRKG